jgi:HEAT repeat protein
MATSPQQQEIVEFFCAQLSREPSSAVRKTIIFQLGELGDESVMDSLMQVGSSDPDPVIRSLAFEALAKIHQKSEQEPAIQELQKVITDLLSKYPDIDRSSIDKIIDVEFTEITSHGAQKTQRRQDLLSIVFAGSSEAVKILVPVAGIPIEVGKRLYEIYKKNRAKKKTSN